MDEHHNEGCEHAVHHRVKEGSRGHFKDFRAARWENEQKTGDARATVYLNGEKVQDDVALRASTLLGDPEADSPGPIVLQDHGSKVSFRNVWVRPRAAQGAELP